MIIYADNSASPDYLSEIQLIMYLLVAYREYLDEQRQQALFNKLKDISNKLDTNASSIARVKSLCIMPLPLLKGVRPSKLHPLLEPHHMEKKVEKTNSPFIFSPFERNSLKVHKFTWVKNEPCKVDIDFVNPFLVDLHLTRVSLKCKVNNEYFNVVQIYEADIVVKRLQEATCTLLLKPQQPGELIFESVTFELGNSSLKK